jgi:hypothetical protein
MMIAPKNIVENLCFTMYYIVKKKICFTLSAASASPYRMPGPFNFQTPIEKMGHSSSLPVSAIWRDVEDVANPSPQNSINNPLNYTSASALQIFLQRHQNAGAEIQIP